MLTEVLAIIASIVLLYILVWLPMRLVSNSLWRFLIACIGYVVGMGLVSMTIIHLLASTQPIEQVVPAAVIVALMFIAASPAACTCWRQLEEL